MKPLRVALVAVLAAERWPSMDLVADALLIELQRIGARGDMTIDMIRPTLTARGRRVGRYVNRFWDYPRWIAGRTSAFDVFHVVDHSYAHLVHALPPGRTVVTCHDVDAFLPLVRPEATESRLPRVLTRRILSGLRKAARVAVVSRATADDVRRYGLVPSERIAMVSNGVHPGYAPQCDVTAEAAVDRLLGPRDAGVPTLLHVGSTIARKRIDLLLRIVAAVRDIHPGVRLVKAGGALTADQRALVNQLGLERHLIELPFLEVSHLAAVYRRAAMVLVTSEREGFGLPTVEAMACGTPVIATDLAVLREVGGDAAVYCALGDVASWRDAVLGLLDPAARASRRTTSIERAGAFSWATAAASMAALYQEVAA